MVVGDRCEVIGALFVRVLQIYLNRDVSCPGTSGEAFGENEKPGDENFT